MFVSNQTVASVAFVVPDGGTPSRFRVAVGGEYGPWTPTTLATIRVSADINTLSGADPIEGRVVELDVTTDILTQTYLVVSDAPLQVMVNSFVTMGEAGSIASTRRDVSAWQQASYVDRITSLIAAYEILVGYRYFIYRECRDDWDARQAASWNLPFSDSYESINSLEDFSADEFSELRKDFLKRIKVAQIVAACAIINQASIESPLDTDPNLISEKIGDTSRTWRAARTAQPLVGKAAMRLLSDYISSTPRLTRV